MTKVNITKEQKDTMLKMHSEGKTISDMSRVTGKNRKIITKFIVEDQKLTLNSFSFIDEKTVKEMIKLNKEGLTNSAIGVKLNLSHDTIKAHLTKRGITPNTVARMENKHICVVCNKQFITRDSRKMKTCSKECKTAFRKGKLVSTDQYYKIIKLKKFGLTQADISEEVGVSIDLIKLITQKNKIYKVNTREYVQEAMDRIIKEVDNHKKKTGKKISYIPIANEYGISQSVAHANIKCSSMN